ncbi:LexA family protein [Anaerotignum sp.]|uniref:LexA family protein n=1 Tax=Anaerotignum sp. TaxID=2039241 RepID=UPI003A93CDB8
MSDELQKSIFSKNLKYYMDKNNKTQTDIIEDLGINKSTISTWCNGTKMPSMDTIQKLADYFGIKKSNLVEDRMEFPLGAMPYIPESTTPIPLIGSVNCGTPLFAEDNIEAFISTPEADIQTGEVYFWLRAKGNSMINAGIHDGDLLLIRQQNDVDSGDIAVVAVNGDDATLKRVKKQKDAIILQPENPTCETMIFVGKDREKISIRGRLMQLRKNF